MSSKVSIITAGWNGKDFICRTLNSILAQTYKCLQYIYVDDGSTDGTQDIVLSYETRFKEAGIEFLYIRQTNGGISAAINTGLQYVTGEFLCFLEYDDMITPDSIEKKLHFLQGHPDFAVVTSDGLAFKESALDKPLGFLSHKNPNRFKENHFIELLHGETHTVIYAACHMIRMSAFDATHPDRKIYPSRQGPNLQILLPLYYRYKRGFIDEPLMYYIIRDASISHSYSKTAQSWYETLRNIQTIYNETIDTIEMSDDERAKYKKIVNLRFAHQYLVVAPTIKDRKLGEQAYQYLSTQNEITFEDRFHHLRLRCNCLEFAIPLLKRLKHLLIRNPRSY